MILEVAVDCLEAGCYFVGRLSQRGSLSMYTMNTRRLHTLLADWTVSMVTITGFCSLCYCKVVSGKCTRMFQRVIFGAEASKESIRMAL